MQARALDKGEFFIILDIKERLSPESALNMP
jgi:hypothetical protein